MTTMTEEITDPRTGLSVGDRVRLERTSDGRITEDTVTRVWPGEDWGMSFENACLIHNGQWRSGEYRVYPLRVMLGDSGFYVGQRARVSTTGTEVTLASICGCGETCRMIRDTDGTSWRAEALEAIQDEPAPEPDSNRPLQVGDRVRVSSPAFSHVGERGYVDPRFYGAECTVLAPPRANSAAFRVGNDRGDSNVIHPDHLSLIAETRAAGDFRPGDRVRVDYPTGAIHPGATGVVREVTSEDTHMSVQMDGQTSGGAYGNGLYRIDRTRATLLDAATVVPARQPGVFHIGDQVVVGTDSGQGLVPPGTITTVVGIPTPGSTGRAIYRIAHPDHTPRGVAAFVEGLTLVDPGAPVPSEPERLPTVDPLPIGQRVLAGRYVGTVVSKSEAPAFAVNEASRTSAEHVAVRSKEGEVSMHRVVNVTVLDVELGSRTVEQRLLRLQTLVHRVASFEAVQREWCNEVNSALAMLYAEDPDAPVYLQTVDRRLGERLQDDPRSIYQFEETAPLPAEAASDEPETEERDYQATLSVDYAASSGFNVQGATVCVSFTAEVDPDEGFVGDAADYITDEMVDSAIDSDSDLPDSEGTYSLSWSVESVDEV